VPKKWLQRLLGKTIVIDSRSGTSGSVGKAAVVKSSALSSTIKCKDLGQGKDNNIKGDQN